MIQTKQELIDYLGTAWVKMKQPIILYYLSRAEAVETSEELEELCKELGV